jgi:apolipoprotein N-acyltransferase
MDSIENAESPLHFEDAKMNQSQFYFGMARASQNPRTVMVSCQFGDEYLVKTYKRILEVLEIKTLPYLREVLTRHLNNIQTAFERIENMLLENIPVLRRK